MSYILILMSFQTIYSINYDVPNITYIENNTWLHGNTIFISSVEHNISRVSAANE